MGAAPMTPTGDLGDTIRLTIGSRLEQLSMVHAVIAGLARQYELDDEIELTRAEYDLTVSEPYGIDNYFLLTSAQPIDNPDDVFNFSGARTRSVRGVSNPLARLISDRAMGTRGSLSGVPTNWSIERVAFRSVEPKQPN